MTAPSTTSTRSVWLAAHLLDRGLEFLRAERLPGPAFRVAFFFRDSHGDAPRLTRQFPEDTSTQRLISARRAMAEALDVVSQRPCEANDIAGALAMVGAPWADR